jgi:hypothetical protein
LNENLITREEAVGRIRQQLIAMNADGKSVCRIAAERNILCGGFHRDSDDELRARYAGRIDGPTELSREELEDRANTWQLERQKNEGVRLSCDVQQMFYETCRGWDDFSNEELSRFCFELLGEEVAVLGKKAPAVV